MRIWFLVFLGALALAAIALADRDIPELYACPPSGGHHGNQPYGSQPRQYVYDDSDPVLLSRDLSYDCTSPSGSQCMELHTDYKNLYDGLCQRAVGSPDAPGMLETTECENFCFYAVCLDCALHGHLHPLHPHTHRHCGDCSRHTHWHRGPTVFHSWIASPCTDWHWRIFDPTVDDQIGRKDGRSIRQDHSAPPPISETLEFGMVPPGYAPEQPECVNERGDVESFDDGLTSLPLPSNFGENAHPGDLRAGIRPHAEEFTVGDLSHLPYTPPEPGAPRLVSVTKDQFNDRIIRLNVSGGMNVQYRYWSYNGIREMDRNAAGNLVVGVHEDSPILIGEGWNPGPDAEASPRVFRLPFAPLYGDIFIDPGIKGIVSFQVRSVDGDGVGSGVSNIVHEMIGLEGLRSIGPVRGNLEFYHPLPTPPPPSTPLPTPSVPGVVLPPTPSVPSVEQVVDAVGTIDIDLRVGYAGYIVEYRVWDHSGFDPWDVDEVPDMSIPWEPAPVTSGTFRVAGVLSKLEYPLHNPENPRVPVVVPPPATPAFKLPPPAPGPTRPFPTPFPTPVPLTPWPVVMEPTPSFPISTPVPTRPPIPVPAHFNVQVRLVGPNGLPGNPSLPVVVRVWTGFYTGWDR